MLKLGKLTLMNIGNHDITNIEEYAKTGPFHVNYLNSKGLGSVINNTAGVFIGNINREDISDFIHLEDLPDFNGNQFYWKLPKIPINTLYQVATFFKDIIETIGNYEAYAIWYWDTKDQVFIVDVPKQEISGGRVATTEKTSPQFKDMRYINVLEIHSHNTMNAYFSSVDDADEKKIRCYGVLGQLNKDQPAFVLRAGGSVMNIKLNATDIFDADFIYTKVDYPEIWKNQLDTGTKRTIAKEFNSDRNRKQESFYEWMNRMSIRDNHFERSSDPWATRFESDDLEDQASNIMETWLQGQMLIDESEPKNTVQNLYEVFYDELSGCDAPILIALDKAVKRVRAEYGV